MKTPTFLTYKNFSDEVDLTPEQIIECCDSAVAVLDENLLAEWLEIFAGISNMEDAAEYCDFCTATMTFMIEGKLLVCVIDSGGELCSGDFAAFCEERGIPVQTIVDTLVFEGCSIDEMYTGQMEDNPELMRLVHQITN